MGIAACFAPPIWHAYVSDTPLFAHCPPPTRYNSSKVEENVECEIMQVVQDEAVQAFPDASVRVYHSNTTEDFDRNVGRLVAYIRDPSAQLESSDPGL